MEYMKYVKMRIGIFYFEKRFETAGLFNNDLSAAHVHSTEYWND
jgi:hypothetical protein